jgi:acyl carrier protein
MGGRLAGGKVAMESGTTATGNELWQQVLDNFGGVASKVLGRDVGQVSLSTGLRDDLGMTSVSILEVMLDLEDVLHIEIDVEKLDQQDLASVGTMADFIALHARPAL